MTNYDPARHYDASLTDTRADTLTCSECSWTGATLVDYYDDGSAEWTCPSCDAEHVDTWDPDDDFDPDDYLAARADEEASWAEDYYARHDL